jgi:hypothetical protein
MGTDSASMDIAASVKTGTPVMTKDGLRFATVKDVRGGYFQLDVARQEDFWLSASYIESADSNGVRLGIDRDEVDEHRLNQPGIERSDAQAPTGDAVLSNDEALAQRERMERELEAQRQRMGRSSDSGVIGTTDSSVREGAENTTADEDDAGGIEREEAVEREHDEMIRQRDERVGFRYDQ